MSNTPKFKSQNNPTIRSNFGIVILVLGIALILISLMMVIRPPGNTVLSPPRVGKFMSNFSITDVNGNTVELVDYSGKTILLNTWATWCPPCRAEMPGLNDYYLRYRGQGFIILAVNVGESVAQAAAFADEYNLSFPVLMDKNYQLVDSLGINSYPTSILIGSDGRVKYIHIGLLTPDMLAKTITPLWTEN